MLCLFLIGVPLTYINNLLLLGKQYLTSIGGNVASKVFKPDRMSTKLLTCRQSSSEEIRVLEYTCIHCFEDWDSLRHRALADGPKRSLLAFKQRWSKGLIISRPIILDDRCMRRKACLYRTKTMTSNNDSTQHDVYIYIGSLLCPRHRPKDRTVYR